MIGPGNLSPNITPIKKTADADLKRKTHEPAQTNPAQEIFNLESWGYSIPIFKQF